MKKLALDAALKSADARPYRPSKYGNRRVTDADGTKFASVRELKRWQVLKMLERTKMISELTRQVPIELMGQSGPVKTDTGRTARIVVDFRYREDGVVVYEDAKGFETAESKFKRAVLRAMGIEVKLV